MSVFIRRVGVERIGVPSRPSGHVGQNWPGGVPSFGGLFGLGQAVTCQPPTTPNPEFIDFDATPNAAPCVWPREAQGGATPSEWARRQQELRAQGLVRAAVVTTDASGQRVVREVVVTREEAAPVAPSAPLDTRKIMVIGGAVLMLGGAAYLLLS